MSNFKTMLNEITSRLDTLTKEAGVKQATEGPPTSTPADGSDNGTTTPNTGHLFGEYNEANVEGEAMTYTSDSQSEQAHNKGTNVSAVGEDPSLEDDWKTNTIDPGTSNPANATKQSALSTKFAEFSQLSQGLMASLGMEVKTAPDNAQLTKMAEQQVPFQEKAAFVYNLMKEAAFEAELVAPIVQYVVNTDQDVIEFCKAANLIEEDPEAAAALEGAEGAEVGMEPGMDMGGGDPLEELSPEDEMLLNQILQEIPPEELMALLGGEGEMGGGEMGMEEEVDPEADISDDEALAALDAEMAAQDIPPEKLAAAGHVKTAQAIVARRARNPKMAKAQAACRKFLGEIIPK